MIASCGRPSFRAFHVCFALVLGLAPGGGTTLADDTGETTEIWGVLLDPVGEPAIGTRVVLRDLASDQVYTSERAGDDGAFIMVVPAGRRYALSSVIAPDGSPILFEGQVPIKAVAGKLRLDVRLALVLQRVDDYGIIAEGRPPAPAPPRQPPPAASTPWYKKPGGILAIVIGTVGTAAAAGGGGGDGVASPSQP